MKKVMIVVTLGLFLTLGLMSCGAGQGGHCDAYGSIDNVNVENADLASK